MFLMFFFFFLFSYPAVQSQINKFVYKGGTVDREYSGVTVRSSGIGRDALVSSGVPRHHAVDAQEAEPLIGYDINVRSARVYRGVVERPRQGHREVALEDRAGKRQHLAGVEGIVAERELEDLWRDCAKRRVRQDST